MRWSTTSRPRRSRRLPPTREPHWDWLDGDDAASNLAEMLLRMLGVPSEDAHDVARRPLPDVDGAPRART
ncbi:hypothetical protein AQJ27_48640 [Streptomyces olivochromogenes]|nr:hypothetical protein AQJ27_48640 [Streptomyces olivochromogenes]